MFGAAGYQHWNPVDDWVGTSAGYAFKVVRNERQVARACWAGELAYYLFIELWRGVH